jgi:MFS family permease
MFPLLFVGTAMAYFVLALPFGRLADRLGRHRLFLAGHAFVALAYALLLRSHLSTLEVLTCVALLGAYYAATDGVLPALASTVLPAPHLTTGLAVVSTVVALARLVAASIFGAIWTWWGANGVLIAFTVGLLAAMASASTLLRVSRPWPGGQTA